MPRSRMPMPSLAPLLGRVALLLAFVTLLVARPSRAADDPTGLLAVQANVQGARVSVDGKEAGVTPLTLVATAGSHQVRVESPGFDPFSREVTVLAGKKVLVDATLVRVAGVLDIAVTPDGATVTVDGRVAGTGGRVRIDPIEPGTHQVRIEKPGHEPWAGKVTVFRGQSVTVPVQLASAFGAMAVESDPPGAAVTVDGEERGRTPTVVEGLETGLHSVRVSLDGHADAYQSVRVDRQGRSTLRVVLPTPRGTLVLRAGPGTPRLSLDGYELGEAQELTIPNVGVGIHGVKASRPGWSDALATVKVNEGQVTEVSLRLSTEPSRAEVPRGSLATRPRPRPKAAPWVVLGVALAAGAGVGIGLAVEAQAQQPEPAMPVTPPTGTVQVALP